MEVILEKEMNECKKTRKVIVEVKKKKKGRKRNREYREKHQRSKNSD